MSPKSMTRFFTVTQISEMLGISTRSVRRWVAAGELLAHKFRRQVRVSEIDLLAFLQRHRDV